MSRVIDILSKNLGGLSSRQLIISTQSMISSAIYLLMLHFEAAFFTSRKKHISGDGINFFSFQKLEKACFSLKQFLSLLFWDFFVDQKPFHGFFSYPFDFQIQFFHPFSLSFFFQHFLGILHLAKNPSTVSTMMPVKFKSIIDFVPKRTLK